MTTVHEQLVKHLDEAHAMEHDMLRMLDGLISTTRDPEVLRELEHHRIETQEHAEQMRARLRAHGATPSAVRQLTGIVGALAKLPLDMVRGEKAGRNARDGYAAEHLEIAAYELLKRVAARAGDDETVETCDRILEQERRMVAAIEAEWDRFVDLSLREEGVTVDDAA